jgi:hypothetical protein
VDYPNGNGAIRRGFLTAAAAAEWIRQEGGQPMPPPIDPLRLQRVALVSPGRDTATDEC